MGDQPKQPFGIVACCHLSFVQRAHHSCFLLPFSMTSEVSISHPAADLSSNAAKYNKNGGARESAAMELEPFESEQK